MKVLTIRTDRSVAEVRLFEDNKKLGRTSWQAHRELSVTLLSKIENILNRSSIGWEDLGGIIVFKGPGSFTGLRIGISAANAFALGLDIPIVSASGADWTKAGIKRLLAGENEKVAVPEYGAPPHTTPSKK